MIKNIFRNKNDKLKFPYAEKNYPVVNAPTYSEYNVVLHIMYIKKVKMDVICWLVFLL